MGPWRLHTAVAQSWVVAYTLDAADIHLVEAQHPKVCLNSFAIKVQSAISSGVLVQLVARLRELALIRALECRERGAGPEQMAVEADLSGSPCKLRMQVSTSTTLL
jgi:hypothetical protein